ncbi:hypothetical protein HYH03_009727 [Edaphochlamys debaryana]|uniref:Cyclic nucleotide-binding domain-containing protein n=1 Tax=Edaphochlamys debaryana TaxID=47281 RepID=A0A836BXG8_9CHLO|nr:hypothetical protein HYH03_009727 [Edaphochlamys debaryana]|eukprot:KAG2491997.1 hypothetical protein HYH03_009727 [Edaphochlamys debaryana]
MSLAEVLRVLGERPAHRSPEDLQLLAQYFQQQAFFAGVDPVSVQHICSALTLQRAQPGEVLLHVGELTDRLYLVLGGRLSVVRHSRREGFSPGPPTLVTQGQTLCEASLALSGRRSDLAVTVAAETEAGEEEAVPEGPSGPAAGAALAVLTRAAWGNLCAKAPIQASYGEARLALLCAAARAVCQAAPPEARTLEQADDLAALLKQLPGLSTCSAPVLRAMSEAAVLRRLPPGTILYEEYTRAESEFVVLGGSVKVRCRAKRLGGRSNTLSGGGLRASRLASSRRALAQESRRRSAAGPSGGASIQEKIEEERRARDAMRESLALTRDGTKDPPTQPAAPMPDKARAFMLEFVQRARKTNPAQMEQEAPRPPESSHAAAAPAPTPLSGSVAPSAPATAPVSRATTAWRRAAMVARSGPSVSGGSGTSSGPGLPELDSEADAARGGDGDDEVDESDAMIMEYRRRKQEAEGKIKDVGKLLGGEGARSAYLSAIKSVSGFQYAEEPEPAEANPDKGVKWADQPAAGGGEGEAGGVSSGGEEDEAAAPRVRLVFMDRHYRLAARSVRLADAMEKLVRLARERSSRADPGGDMDDSAAEPTILTDDTPDDSGAGSGPMPASPARARRAGRGTGAGAGEDGEEAEEEEAQEAGDVHIAQLYGAEAGGVATGHVAGELPAVVLNRVVAGAGAGAVSSGTPARGGGARARRSNTAIAGLNGADVLVVALEALRRGHDAARDDLVSGRLAVLEALEPLRALSEEHRAALALGAAMASLDAGVPVAWQGQAVEALYVVMEGEVRLVDDPEGVVASAASGLPGLPGVAVGSSSAPPSATAPAPAASSVSFGPSSVASKDRATLGTASFAANSLSISSRAADAVAAAEAAVAGAGVGSPPNAAPLLAPTTLKARRAVAALPTLSLLGPGGSLGESVLGYPEDLEREAEEKAAAKERALRAKQEAEEDGGEHDAAGSDTASVFALGAVAGSRAVALASGGTAGGPAPGAPVSAHPASAVTAKPTRLLILPRALLHKFFYLRSALPPFADLRREALGLRRAQLQASSLHALGPQGAAAAAAAAQEQAARDAGGAAALAAALASASGVGAGAAYAVVGSPGLGSAASMPLPRPPPPRPVEFLEQMGFKTLSNPRTAALLGSAATGGGGAHSGTSTPERRLTVTGPRESFSGVGGAPGSGPSTPTAAGAAAPGSPAALPPTGGSLTPRGSLSGLPPAGSPAAGYAAIVAADRTRRLSLLGGERAAALGSPAQPGSPAAADSVRAQTLPQVAEDLEGNAGPARPAPQTSAAMAMQAKYESMTPGEMDLYLSNTAGPGGNDSWQSLMQAAGGGGRAPAKPRVLRTSLSGSRFGGVGHSQSTGAYGTMFVRAPSPARVSSSGLPTLSTGGGAAPPSSAFATTAAANALYGGGTFISRLESMERRTSNHRTSLLSVESFDQDGAAAAPPPPEPLSSAGGVSAPPIHSHLSGSGGLSTAGGLSVGGGLSFGGGLSAGGGIVPTKGSALPLLASGGPSGSLAKMVLAAGIPGGAGSGRGSGASTPGIHSPQRPMRMSYNGSGSLSFGNDSPFQSGSQALPSVAAAQALANNWIGAGAATAAAQSPRTRLAGGGAAAVAAKEAAAAALAAAASAPRASAVPGLASIDQILGHSGSMRGPSATALAATAAATAGPDGSGSGTGPIRSGPRGGPPRMRASWDGSMLRQLQRGGAAAPPAASLPVAAAAAALNMMPVSHNTFTPGSTGSFGTAPPVPAPPAGTYGGGRQEMRQALSALNGMPP